MNPGIQDIFKKAKDKKKKEEKANLVLVDYREKNSTVPSKLMDLKTPLEIKELKVADYVIGDIAIERKTFSDFVSSMVNKRLLRQLQDLKQYPKPLIIIEGCLRDFDFNISPNAIKGFILSISLTYKIPIIFTENSTETAEYINLISRKKPTNMSLNVSKKNLTKKQQLQFILESFPKIGPKTSEKLLTHFTTIKQIINAPEEELKEILGKKAKEIHEIINNTF